MEMFDSSARAVSAGRMIIIAMSRNMIAKKVKNVIVVFFEKCHMISLRFLRNPFLGNGKVKLIYF